jgi:hypothetical protein
VLTVQERFCVTEFCATIIYFRDRMPQLVNSQIPLVERDRFREVFSCLTAISSLVPTSQFKLDAFPCRAGHLKNASDNMSLTVTDEIKPNFDEPIDRRQS